LSDFPPTTPRGKKKEQETHQIALIATSHLPSFPLDPSPGRSKKMAQGTIKVKKPSAATTARRPSALGPKKGARTIAPRKQTLVKNMKMAKVCFSLLLFFFCACCGWWFGRVFGKGVLGILDFGFWGWEANGLFFLLI
jgi:hypothetical protein